MKKMYKGDSNHYEKMDSGYMGMISEDRSAHANLPQEVKMVNYPKNNYMNNYYQDDTMKGIDDNIKNSAKKIKSNMSDSMY